MGIKYPGSEVFLLQISPGRSSPSVLSDEVVLRDYFGHSDQSKICIAAIIDCKPVIFLQTGMMWAVFTWKVWSEWRNGKEGCGEMPKYFASQALWANEACVLLNCTFQLGKKKQLFCNLQQSKQPTEIQYTNFDQHNYNCYTLFIYYHSFSMLLVQPQLILSVAVIHLPWTTMFFFLWQWHISLRYQLI